jgi:hypothetical protein
LGSLPEGSPTVTTIDTTHLVPTDNQAEGTTIKERETPKMESSVSSLSFVQDLLFTDRKNSDSASIHSNATTDTKAKPKQSSSQLTDILVEKLLSMAMPPTTQLGVETIEDRVAAGRARPVLSVQTMSKNFIQMNARLSIAFEFLDNVILFFSWQQPSLTLAILMIYTHIVLKPLALLSLPPFFLLIYIMAPAYSSTHRPEYHTVLGKTNPVLADGPRLKPVEIPQPASEFSKEFLLNMTDLQNHMVLYTQTWDGVIHWLSKFAYFINESISAAFYVGLFTLGAISLIFGDSLIQLIPFKFILLTIGWGVTIVFHPYFHDYVFDLVYSEETRYYLLNKTNKIEAILEHQFGYMELQEQREVEIFEVHKLNKNLKEWQLMSFMDSDFTRLSQQRILETTNGVISKHDVKPPRDWEFITSDQWQIDLSPELWVKERMVTNAVRLDHETKWVYDSADEDNHFQPEYRRRRWTRIVTRQSYKDGAQSDEDTTESQI